MSPFKWTHHKKAKAEYLTAYTVADRVTGQIIGITEKYAVWSKEKPGDFKCRWRALTETGVMLGEGYATQAEAHQVVCDNASALVAA